MAAWVASEPTASEEDWAQAAALWPTVGLDLSWYRGPLTSNVVAVLRDHLWRRQILGEGSGLLFPRIDLAAWDPEPVAMEYSATHLLSLLAPVYDVLRHVFTQARRDRVTLLDWGCGAGSGALAASALETSRVLPETWSYVGHDHNKPQLELGRRLVDALGASSRVRLFTTSPQEAHKAARDARGDGFLVVLCSHVLYQRHFGRHGLASLVSVLKEFATPLWLVSIEPHSCRMEAQNQIARVIAHGRHAVAYNDQPNGPRRDWHARKNVLILASDGSNRD